MTTPTKNSRHLVISLVSLYTSIKYFFYSNFKNLVKLAKEHMKSSMFKLPPKLNIACCGEKIIHASRDQLNYKILRSVKLFTKLLFIKLKFITQKNACSHQLCLPFSPPDGSCLSHNHQPSESASISCRRPVIDKAPTQQ